jgi:hypothetical protein
MRPNDGRAMRDLRAPGAQEDRREGRQLADHPRGHDFAVVIVAIADRADDLLRLGDDRQVANAIQRDRRRDVVSVCPDQRCTPGGDVGLQGVLLRIGICQVGHAVAQHGAPGGLALAFEGEQFHFERPFRVISGRSIRQSGQQLGFALFDANRVVENRTLDRLGYQQADVPLHGV